MLGKTLSRIPGVGSSTSSGIPRRAFALVGDVWASGVFPRVGGPVGCDFWEALLEGDVDVEALRHSLSPQGVDFADQVARRCLNMGAKTVEMKAVSTPGKAVLPSPCEVLFSASRDTARTAPPTLHDRLPPGSRTRVSTEGVVSASLGGATIDLWDPR